MKFLNYFQLILSILIFVCMVALIVKNIIVGAIGLLGVPIVALFFVLSFMLVLFAWAEVREYNDNEKTLKR